MRIYIAAPYFARNALRNYAFQLEAAGHIMTCTWLKADHKIEQGTVGTAPAMSDAYAAEHATQDVEDVLASDALVLFTWNTAISVCPEDLVPGSNSGGRHVETGLALAQAIPVLVYGAAENIFHRGPGFTLCPTWEDVLDTVEEVQAARFGRAATAR